MSLSKHSEPSKSPPWVVTNRRLVVIWLLLGVAAAAIAWLMSTEEIRPNPEAHLGVNRPLSYLELLPLTGGSTSVSRKDLLGRVTLLNFWGTWCSPCREELPHMAELRSRYAGHEAFQLLAVSYPSGDMLDDVRSLREETAALLKTLDLDLPTYYDPDGETRTALDGIIRFEGYPTTVLLDRRGVVRAVWVGYVRGVETEMEQLISAVLEEEDKPAEERHEDAKETEKRK